jgi:hypothetical protein
LDELRAKVGVTAFNSSAKVCETPSSVAVRVAACDVVTAAMVAEKTVLVALAGIVTEAGTVTAASLLLRSTLRPPLGAAAVNETVQTSVPAPVRDALVHDKLPTVAVAAAIPVPLRATTAEPPLAALLETVICPVAAPADLGAN